MRRGADASAALLADPARFTGVTGAFAAQLRVAEGYEVAIAAALGAAAEAIAVSGLDAAAGILATLRRDDAGSAALVIGSGTPLASASSSVPASSVPASSVSASLGPPAPSGAGPFPAADLVRAPAELARATAGLLQDEHHR